MAFKIGDKVHWRGQPETQVITDIAFNSSHGLTYAYLNGFMRESRRGVAMGTLTLVPEDMACNMFRVLVEWTSSDKAFGDWEKLDVASRTEYATRAEACAYIAKELKTDMENNDTDKYRYTLQEKGGWVDVPFEISVS